jgi:hypothetical protein
MSEVKQPRKLSGLQKSCQTLYQSTMRTLWVIAFSLFLTFSAGLGKNRHCMLRLHMAANPRDTEVFATAVRAKFSGKPVAIERVARISEGDVTAFYPYHTADGSYGVLLQLDEHGRVTLEALSIERRGSLLFVFVNGRPITEFEIDKRVSDGRIYIPSGLSATDIQLMKKDWRLIGERNNRR